MLHHSKMSLRAKLFVFGIPTLFIAIILLLPSVDNTQEANSHKRIECSYTKDKINQVPVPVTETDYVSYFQRKWDSTKLSGHGIIPYYGKYLDSLSAINEQMVSIISTAPDSFKKLNALRLKFVNSDKMTKANKDYLVYGQVPFEEYLKAPCETWLDENLNDPSSLEVISYTLKGQHPNGWAAYMKIRAKNAFGAKVVEIYQFDIRYSAEQKDWYVYNANQVYN